MINNAIAFVLLIITYLCCTGINFFLSRLRSENLQNQEKFRVSLKRPRGITPVLFSHGSFLTAFVIYFTTHIGLPDTGSG